MFGIVVFFALVFRFEKGLALLILLVPFIDILPETGIPGLNGITVIVLTAFAMALTHKSSELKYTDQWALSTPIIILLFLAIISSFYTHLFRNVPDYDIGISIFFIKRWYTFILLYFIYRNGVKTRKHLESCVFMIVLGVILEGLFVVREDLLTSRGRTYGSLGNENDLGAFFAAYFPIGIFFFLDSEKRYKKWTGGAMVLFALLGISLSLSRGAFLGVLVAILIFFFFRSKALFAVVLILMVLVVVNYRFVLPERVVERIDFTFQGSSELQLDPHLQPAGVNIQLDQQEVELEGSAGGRLILWKGALRMFKDHPIFGVGFGAFHLLSLEYLAGEGFRIKKVAHNIYMQILAEMGVIGIVAFLSILVLAFRSGLQLRNKSTDSFGKGLGVAFLACHLSLMVANIFGNRYYNGALTGYFWILAALVSNALPILKRENVDEAKDEDMKKLPIRVQRRLEADRRRQSRKARHK